MAAFGRGIRINCCMSSCRRESRESEEVEVRHGWLSALSVHPQRRWNKQEENFPPGSAACDENTDEIGLK